MFVWITIRSFVQRKHNTGNEKDTHTHTHTHTYIFDRRPCHTRYHIISAHKQTQRTTHHHHHHHHHFLFTAATQSNTRQSFATRSVVNKRVNAFIETLRQRCNKKATQYCPQTVDIGLCSVRSLGAHSEQCSFIKFMNSMCCGSSPYGSK